MRHWHRNLYQDCDTYDADEVGSNHPDRYDGEMFAHSAHDIWKLIKIIEESQNIDCK